MARFGIAYCAGFDPESRDVVGVMTEEAARARDAAGEPYSVVVFVNGQIWWVYDVDWGHGYLGRWEFDRYGRRLEHFDYRRLEPDRCRLANVDIWRYYGPDQAEFHPDAYHESIRVGDAEGNSTSHVRWGRWGPSGGGRPTIDPKDLWIPARDLDWLTYPGMVGDDATEVREPGSPAIDVRPPWQAPRPHGPGRLSEALAPGTRWVETGLDIEHVTEAVDGGVLRLSTGRVVVAECGPHDAVPYTVEVAPGEYRVTVLMVRDHQEGYDFYAGLGAVRLEIRDEPVSSWEMAVRPGEDVRTLPDGHWYGFPVDGGTGTFYDAAASGIAADGGLIWLLSQENTWRTWRIHDPPGASANLFLFTSTRGDGRFPVWVGRTGSGEVACVVADMLLLSSATEVRPGPPPEPLPEVGYRRSEPP